MSFVGSVTLFTSYRWHSISLTVEECEYLAFLVVKNEHNAEVVGTLQNGDGFFVAWRWGVLSRRLRGLRRQCVFSLAKLFWWIVC